MSEKSRTRMFFKQLAFAAAIAVSLGACGHEEHPDGAEVNCDLETRDDTYVANLEKAGSDVTVALMESTPAPPAKNDNTWRVRVVDVNGAPLSGLSLAVTPWMPDHGHGTLVAPVVTEQAEAGEYLIEPVNLRMPGLWDVTVEVSDGTGLEDEVMFSFCIEG